jgi:hypothetical protein
MRKGVCQWSGSARDRIVSSHEDLEGLFPPLFRISDNLSEVVRERANCYMGVRYREGGENLTQIAEDSDISTVQM